MDFWDESWSAIDKSRLREYITRKEEPDEMIEYLLCQNAKVVCDAGCGWDAGFDPVYGARPIKRVIQQQIEDKLSEQMLEGKVTTGKKYICKAENGKRSANGISGK